MKSSKICRLCLKVCRTNFQPVQETTKAILEVLLVEMDLDISVNPVNCKECLENLQESFEFKSVCILTEKNVIDFLESRHICKINMSQVYLNDAKSNSTLSRLEEVCRFCAKPVTKFFSVDKLDEDINFSNMVEEFLPEVTLCFSKNPVCCSNCLNSLNSYFTFLKSCHDVEKHIKAYCNEENITKEKVELNNVVQYMSKHEIYDRSGEKSISKLKEDIISEVAVPEDQSVEPYFSYSVKTDIKKEPIIEINAADIIDMDMSTTEKQLVETIPSHPTDTNAIILEEHLGELYSSDTCDTKGRRMIKSNTDILLEETINENCVNDEFSEDTEGIDMAEFKMEDIDIKSGNIDMKRIEEKHSQLEDFQCSYCSLVFQFKGTLARHISSIHLKLRPYVCKDCKKPFTRKNKLDSHIVSFHQNNVDLMKTVTYKIYKCDHCTYRNIDKLRITYHMEAQHGNMYEHSQLKNFPCNYCSRVFHAKSHLAGHISSCHLNLKRYFCKDCKKSYTRKCWLDDHIMSFHQKNVDLMKTVTSKIHKCDHCTYRCIDKMKMTTHMKTHGNIHDHSQLKNVQCNYCSRFFRSKRNLTEHISSIHLKLRPYFCEDCKKTFTKKNALDNHIVSYHQKNVDLMKTVTHKIHKCDHCIYININKVKMRMHMKTQHGNIHEHSS